MRVHVHANCQAVPVVGLLREVLPEWDITSFEVHASEITDHLGQYRDWIRTADIVLSQPIHKGFRDRDELSLDWIRGNIRADAELVVFPSMHFSGHHPDLDGVPLEGLPVLSSLLAAHLIAVGCPKDEALCRLLSDDLLSDAEIEGEIRASLDETRRREIDDAIDVCISPYFEEYCRTQIMFHIQNHPLRATTAFVVNGILHRLGQKARVSSMGCDYQADTHVPALPSIVRFLREQSGAVEKPERQVILLHGCPPMTQQQYYSLMLDKLAEFSAERLFSAIERRWPTIQFLRRLADQGSAIPGIQRWRKTD